MTLTLDPEDGNGTEAAGGSGIIRTASYRARDRPGRGYLPVRSMKPPRTVFHKILTSSPKDQFWM